MSDQPICQGFAFLKECVLFLLETFYDKLNPFFDPSVVGKGDFRLHYRDFDNSNLIFSANALVCDSLQPKRKKKRGTNYL